MSYICILLACVVGNVLEPLHAVRTLVHFKGHVSIVLYCSILGPYGRIKWIVYDIYGKDILYMYCAYRSNRYTEACMMAGESSMNVRCMCVHGPAAAMKVSIGNPAPGIHICNHFENNSIINETVLMPETYVNAMYNGWMVRQIACGIWYNQFDSYNSTLIVESVQMKDVVKCETDETFFSLYEDVDNHRNDHITVYMCNIIVETDFIQYSDNKNVYFVDKVSRFSTRIEFDVNKLSYSFYSDCMYRVSWDLSTCNYTTSQRCEARWPMFRSYSTSGQGTSYGMSDFNNRVSFLGRSSACVDNKTHTDLYLTVDKSTRGKYLFLHMDTSGLYVASAYVPHVIYISVSEQDVMTCIMGARDMETSTFVPRPRCEVSQYVIENHTYVANITRGSRYTCTARDDNCMFGTSVSVYSNGSVGKPFIENVNHIPDCAYVAHIESSSFVNCGISIVLIITCFVLIIYYVICI